MKRLLLLAVMPLVAVGFLLSASEEPSAQPSCRRYKVNVPLLHVRKDPEAPGSYMSALSEGEEVCVSDKRTGPNGFIEYKTTSSGLQVQIGGWANVSFMLPLDQSQTGSASEQGTLLDTDGDSTLSAARAPLLFDQPIPYGASQVRGRSIKELAEGTPLFPPIDGLPPEVWQKKCTACHKWTQQGLCDQGTSYISRASEIFRHPHPYGGAYKLSLMRWAATGCK